MAEENAGSDVEAQAQLPLDEPKPAKPRRTRRSKAKASDEAADAEDGTAADKAKPARKGRSKRSKAAKAEAAAEKGVDDLNRTIQEATQASSVPMGAPATTLAEADGEKGGQQGQRSSRQEGEGRRRRRRKGDAFDQPGSQNNNSQRQGRNGRRRNRKNQQNHVVEPSLTREELEGMKVAELRVKAAELGVEHAGVRKKDLVEAIYVAAAEAEGFRAVEGVLDFQNEGYAFLRTGNYMKGDSDAFVHQQVIRQFGLRPGDYVTGSLAPAKSGNNKFPPLQKVETINGRTPEEMKVRPRFRDLTPIYPNERLVMEHGKDSVTGRAIDLVAPIGKGQRGLIVSPPKAGKTTVLKRICQSIAANNPEVHLFCLLVDERPEEVTDMERSIRGQVVASTFDMPASNHTAVSELVIEHAKRLVEMGEDVVVVLDSITRLARAYNLAQPASGRVLSGGVDSAALYPPKKFLGRHGLQDGRGHLRGVQGHRQHGAQARPRPRRPPHLPGHRPGRLGHAQRGPAHRRRAPALRLGHTPHPRQHEQHRALRQRPGQGPQGHQEQRGVPHPQRQEGPAERVLRRLAILATHTFRLTLARDRLHHFAVPGAILRWAAQMRRQRVNLLPITTCTGHKN